MTTGFGYEAKGPKKAVIGAQEVPMKIWCVIGMLLFSLMAQNALAAEDLAWAFAQRHLTVKAPEGWRAKVEEDMSLKDMSIIVPLMLETPYKGMETEEGWKRTVAKYETSVGYALRDSIFVFAYPVVTEADFNSMRERYAQEKNAVRLGGSVLQNMKGILRLLVPLKKGKGGAVIFVIPNPQLGPLNLHRASPMLAAFKSLALPEELFAQPVDPLRYAGKISIPKSSSMSQMGGVRLVWEFGRDKNGQKRVIDVTILPHFPLWVDMPERLVADFSPMEPEGRHWKSVLLLDEPLVPIVHVAKSRDGKALAILHGINGDDAATWQERMDMLDDFAW